jgi:non-ribosomal peptide synthetase component F
MFVNTVPVRVSADGTATVGPWLADVQDQLIAGREFEQTPVSAAQRCSGVPMGEPLYETVLGFQNYFRDEPAKATGAVTVRPVEQQEQTGLPLVVSVAFPPDAVWLRVEYDRSRVDNAVAEWIADRYATLMSDIATAADDTPLSALNLADPDATDGSRVDRLGRPVPGPVPGTVPDTGAWAREQVDGRLELLGPKAGSHDWWLARAIAADPAVAAAVVDSDGEPGESHAWLVAADGRDLDTGALITRLRKVIPAELMPTRCHQLLRLPDTLEALRGGAVTRHAQPRPLADRLAKLPAERRTAFLKGLRDAQTAVAPIRPGRFTGEPPRSVQQQFYDEHTPLRPPPAEAPRSELSRSELSYADYAAWQQDARRAADRDRQAAHWRTVLTGAPASGIPSDRNPAHGTQTLSVAVQGSQAEWLAAVATALARWGRDDEVVLGVVTEPHLPDELNAVTGPFARMLPLRIEAGATPDAVGEALDAARHNADVPWPVLRSLLADNPLVSVAVHDTPGTLAPHAATTIGIDIAPGRDGTELTAVYDGVADRTVADLLAKCAAVLAAGPGVTAADLVTAAERGELLALGDGGITTDEPSTVHALVARQDPDSLAVTAVDGDLTYGQLLDKATKLAGHLVRLGVRPEDRVAICLPRTAAMVWAPLAVMLAGAAYVPVDPHYPEARVAVLCEGVRAVITTVPEKFPAGLTVVPPDAAADADLPSVRPDAAAYVIFTSGSTGRPKGVVVEHRSVVDFSRHIATAYGIDRDTRLLGFAAITFDVSVFDLWSALCAGATLVLAGDEERLSVDKLQKLLQDKRA